jgi:hypothetical protein
MLSILNTLLYFNALDLKNQFNHALAFEWPLDWDFYRFRPQQEEQRKTRIRIFLYCIRPRSVSIRS